MNLLKWIRHFFVPHHTNNHRARILHPSVLVVVVAMFLIYQFGINFALLFEPSILGFATNINLERVIDLTNQERLKVGLSPLSLNGTLSQVAQMKAGDMFAFNYWAHNSPSGRTPWDFFNQAGYRYLYAGENLARDFMNSEAVIQAWMNSSSHRENIVNSKYTEIGLAVVDGTLNGVETTLVVQMFGTPVGAPVAVAESTPAQLISEPVEVLTVEPTMAPVIEMEEIVPESEALEALIEQELLLPVALAQAEGETIAPPLLSPFWLTKTVAVFLLGIIMGALVLDIILVSKRQVVRLSGRSIAHLIFVGTLLLAVLLTTPGVIL